MRLDDIDEAATEAQRIIQGNQINWEALFNLADYHTIKPQLAQLANRISPELIPRNVRERLESAYHQNLTDQLSHVTEFFRVKKRLDEAAIMMAPFKGFWLADAFYGNLADREGSDIDVFVNFADMAKIIELMPETEYELGEPYIKALNKKDCEYNFGRYADGRCISHFEFHWRIAPSGFGLDISLSDLASQTMPGRLQDQDLSVFTPSASLLLTIMHHGGKDPLIRLKHVYDIARILDKNTDIEWDWLISEAKRFHVEDLVYAAVKLAAVLTGAKVPGEILTYTESDKVRKLVANRMKFIEVSPEKWRTKWFISNEWLFRIRSRNGLAVKLRLMLYFVRKQIMPWIIPKRLHFLFIKKSEKPGYLK